MLTLAFPSKVSHKKILAENRDSNLKGKSTVMNAIMILNFASNQKV